MNAKERIRLSRRAGVGHIDAVLELAAEAKRAGESEARLLKVLRRACSWAADQGLDEDTSEHCRPLWLDDAEVAIAAAEAGP